MSDGKHAPQILQIEPSRELTFVGPFTDVVNSSLNLRNPSDKPVCFKVKTTAPKQYCVRPNSGIIQPGQSKQVTVMLQPLDGLSTAEVGRHKFMVQTCYSPSGEVDLDRVWKEVEPSQLMYSKLTVVFDSASNTNASSQYVREETPASIQYSSPSASIPSMKSSDSGRVQAGFDIDSQLRNEIELRKKAESEKSVLSKEIQELFKKNTKLQQENERSSLTEVGVPTIQVILATIAALLLGLIIGRLF